MTNQPNIIRALIIYGICLPLAALMGYMLTGSQESVYYLSTGHLTPTAVVFGLVLAVLVAPLFLRFHHFLLICCWNMSAVFFFLPGRPALWLGMTAISFLVSIGHRALDKQFRFISLPEITRPLVLMIFVVLVTAEANGGIGIRGFGSSNLFGGRRYIQLVTTIFGYFALTSQRIPTKHGVLIASVFFLGGLTGVIGDLAIRGGGLLEPLAMIFPPFTGLDSENELLGATRYTGLSAFSTAFFFFMMSKYGVRGIFSFRKPWRAAFFIVGVGAGLAGGYRSFLMMITLVFAIQFFLEGMHRASIFPIVLLLLVTCMALAIPFVHKLPKTVQRTVAFLPLPVDPVVRMDADASSNWRLGMWKAVLPTVPHYLLMGKGYGLSAQDFAFTQVFKQQMAGEEWLYAANAGDYHSGPLSLVITFGIWGTAAFLWFLYAACGVLYDNYRYGDPSLKVVNTFLLAVYCAKIFMFFVIVGGIEGDMQSFAGWLGLSVCLNGGRARPAPETKPVVEKSPSLISAMSRSRPAFGRSIRAVD